MDNQMELELRSILCTSIDVSYEYGKTQRNKMTQQEYDVVINTILDDLVDDIKILFSKIQLKTVDKKTEDFLLNSLKDKASEGAESSKEIWISGIDAVFRHISRP